MKVLGVVCSLRKGGNTEILVKLALASAREVGAETELLTMFQKQIAPCDGCYTCCKSGICHIKDDMDEWLVKFEEAQAIIFGTPVFFWSLPGQAKVLVDRLYPLYTTGKLTNKVGAVIVVASSMGHTAVWQTYNSFFCAAHMLAADVVNAFGSGKGDVRRDRHAVAAAKELGRQVVDLASCQFRYPEAYPHPFYRLIKDKYDIESCPSKGRCEEMTPSEGTASTQDGS